MSGEHAAEQQYAGKILCAGAGWRFQASSFDQKLKRRLCPIANISVV
jgi:hypothetical protein